MAGHLIYQTSEGDVLDAICYAHYGRASGVIEKVLDANPKLCEYDVHLPAGVKITLPEIDVAGLGLTVTGLAFAK
ncbi:MAG: tail protein X [Oceanospirillaceae bacterium]|nr:tail protein X [Oceanospirillaceae bacterium]